MSYVRCIYYDERLEARGKAHVFRTLFKRGYGKCGLAVGCCLIVGCNMEYRGAALVIIVLRHFAVIEYKLAAVPVGVGFDDYRACFEEAGFFVFLFVYLGILKIISHL